MRLSEIHAGHSGTLLTEQGYGRVFRFDYEPHRVDPRPQVFVLGRWRHPGTGNTLVCGINLNYLSEEEINALRKVLGSILSKRRLKDRYWEGMRLLPGIFSNAYRTYKQDEVDNVSRETLRKWPSEMAREKEERARRWREMSPDERREAYRRRAEKAAKTRAAKREPIPEPRYE
jgi:hypothetical protein